MSVIRRNWPEFGLAIVLALPWLSLVALGLVWIWQGGHALAWALAAAVLGLIAWPLRRVVKERADAAARDALGDQALPSAGWNAVEREAWSVVLQLADSTAALSFTDTAPIVALLRSTVEAVARQVHPKAGDPWAQFSLPDGLLLAERLCRDIRRELLSHVPGVRAMRLSHLLWVQRQSGRYGALARIGWRIGYGLWRLTRTALHPLQGVVQEVKDMVVQHTEGVLTQRLRSYATRLLIIETGRAAIDLYSGRLALSEEEVRLASASDMAAFKTSEPGPVRILLAGQVNAGKSSLLNAMAQQPRVAIGPLPTTATAEDHAIAVEGHPAVVIVDTPGLGDDKKSIAALTRYAARCDLVVWVASATQPARGPDREGLDTLRSWAKDRLELRPAPILLALTHVDQLRPATHWNPPYDITTPAGPKASSIRAAMDAVASALDLSADAVVPIAMPPGGEPYNIDALWGRIALEMEEAKLVQLDRIRVGHRGLHMRELTGQIVNAGRMLAKGIFKVSPSAR